jgi:hypothetical protein
MPVTKNKKRSNQKIIKNVLMCIVILLSIFILFSSILPGVEASSKSLECSVYRPPYHDSYYKIAEPILNKRNFWCRVFKIKSQCTKGNLKPYELKVINAYFSAENPKLADYSEYLEDFSMDNQEYLINFLYYCYNSTELHTKNRFLPSCPSVVRYTYPKGIKNCPNKNLVVTRCVERPKLPSFGGFWS